MEQNLGPYTLLSGTAERKGFELAFAPTPDDCHSWLEVY
jgi:hypothetical protein